MYDIQSRVFELGMQGFGCSQIMMIMALEMEGKEDADMIRAMGGLTGGIGRCGKCCGLVTGGASAIGYFTCKGKEGETAHDRSRDMLEAYVRWFEERYGSTECQEIIGGDFQKIMSVCAPMVGESFEKVIEILTEYGVLEC